MAGFPHGIPRSLLSNDALSYFSSSISSSSSINITVPIDQLCQPFCEPLNDSGYCLTPCLDYCPDVCRNSLFSYVPPPDALLPPSSIYDSPEVSSGEFHRSSSLSVFLITIFAVISVAFVVTCIYGLLVWARQRRRGVGHGAAEFLQRDVEIRDDDFLDEDWGPIIDHPIWFIRTVGLEASVIDAIASCRYKRGEGLVEGTDCSVCLSEFKEDETLRLLPKCSHAFHIQCIDTWLRSRTNCPVCRAPVLAGDRHRVLDPIHEGNPEDPVLTSDLVDRESIEGEDDVDHLPPSDGLKLDEGRKMRRSASVNSLSAEKISVAVSNASREGNSVISMKNVTDLDENLVRLACRTLSLSSSSISSSSIRRTRSLSWNGRFLATTTCHSRNRSTILPL